MGLLSSLFGKREKVDLGAWIQNGAVILDVRTKGEFQQGHIAGAVNIPLDQLGSSIGKLKKEKAIITCCASGMRSAAAKNLLRKQGFAQVENGGSWQNLRKYKQK
ncbi:MAG: rhodanese-like domain-containing protein [Bacteroidia bacterium]|nr:rhodanese-like domain-containing protein [Bacteroidia bacterium]